KFELLRIFKSLKVDLDVLLWAFVKDTVGITELQNIIKRRLGKYISKAYTLFSIYEPSPYFKDQLRPVNKEPKKYLVAYPMKRDPEWFLLDESERKKMLEEHIRMARLHPEGKGIISYTTYSFGIDDNEYVVIYELDSLIGWSHVVEKLREAKHRKWVIREEPVLIGELYKFLV
ncbi:MAG TPA: chlorite dismutase family protein, partial [Geobacterales bacterium]|nr:chlorite dismutase family protein [Geobacterales bacterium]